MFASVGVDAGRGHVKIVRGDLLVSFPSYRVDGYERKLKDSVLEDGRLIDNLDVEIITIHDGKPVNRERHFLGELARREGAVTTNLRKEVDIDWLRPRVLAALACVLSWDTEVSLVVGIPIADATEANKTAIVQGLRGMFEIRVNGRAIVIRVATVDVIAQAAGAAWNYILDTAGKVYRDTRGQTLGVLDVGMRDVNLVTMDGFKYVDSRSASRDIGLHTAHESAARILRDAYPDTDFTLESVEPWLRKHPEDENRVGDAYMRLTDRIWEWARGFWPNVREIETILLAGGGAIRLQPYLQSHMPKAILVENAQFGNALGFAKLAARRAGHAENA